MEKVSFIRQAKQLVAAGDYAQALGICQEGLAQHPRSVVGRVLWGKALIHLGRPAEAMEQFEQALALDRDNPHAHRLVAEVLLQRGLLRSAIPILKRAVALAPSDQPLRQWLETAQRAANDGTVGTFVGLTDSLTLSDHDDDLDEGPSPEALEPSKVTTADELTQLLRAELENTVVVPDPIPKLARSPVALDPIPEAIPELTPDSVEETTEWADELEALEHIESSAPKKPLLEDLPDADTQTVIAEIPKVELSPQAAKAIAEEYERELRQKLEITASEPTFVQRHKAKVTFAVLGLAALVGLAAFVYTNAVNRGRTLHQALAEARQAILKDTPLSYRESLDRLETAIRMDDSSEEAWALYAYVHALLFHEYGDAEDKARALEGLEKRGVQEQFASDALASRYYLADAKSKDAARRAVLESRLDTPELDELAGRILDGRGDSKRAAQKFKRAVDLNSGNARALVAFANHFRNLGDCQNALAFYATAGLVSPSHPERIVGAAECRLDRGEDLDESLREMDSIPSSPKLPADLEIRRELVHARLLSAAGKHSEAIEKLTAASRRFKDKRFEFSVALGNAERASGDYPSAQKAFESALQERPNNEEALEGLGRALIARDREKDALTRLSGQPESRHLALVRGAAAAKLGDWKRVRTELARTQIGGKFPAEAVVFLALADAAEGEPGRAQEVLEKALAGTKKSKAELRVALGRVYLQRGAAEKAKAQFEEASRDLSDCEALCALGRLYLQQGRLDSAAEKLRLALSRNPSHGEARDALGRVYLGMGKWKQALEQFAAWRANNPSASGAEKGLALTQLQMGKLEEARLSIQAAAKMDATDAEIQRIRAAVLFGKADSKAAFSALERANHLNPRSAETFCQIGQAYLREANIPLSQKAFQAALREEPSSVCGRSGLILAKLPADARAGVKELGELVPRAALAWDRAEVKSVLARAFLATGAILSARKEAQEAVQLEPNSAQAHLALGLVATSQKDDAVAKQALLLCESLDPTNAQVHLALGDLLAHSGSQLERAYQEYQLVLQTASDARLRTRVKRLLPTLKKRLAVR